MKLVRFIFLNDKNDDQYLNKSCGKISQTSTTTKKTIKENGKLLKFMWYELFNGIQSKAIKKCKNKIKIKCYFCCFFLGSWQGYKFEKTINLFTIFLQKSWFYTHKFTDFEFLTYYAKKG